MEESKKINSILDRSISNEIWNTIHNVLQAKEVDIDYRSLGPRMIRNIVNYVKELKNTLEGQKFENASDFYSNLVTKFELPAVEESQQKKAINDFIELLALEENIIQGILNVKNAESSILEDMGGEQKIEMANKLWNEDVEVKNSNVNKKNVTFNDSLKIKTVNTQFYARHEYESDGINPVNFNKENNKNNKSLPIREFSEIEATKIKAKAMSKLGGWYAFQSGIQSIWTTMKKFVTNLFNKNSVISFAEKTLDSNIINSKDASMQPNVKGASTYSDLISHFAANPSKPSLSLSENEIELNKVNKEKVTDHSHQTLSTSDSLTDNHKHSDDLSEVSESHISAPVNKR